MITVIKVLLGQFPMQLFLDPKPQAVLDQFSADIKIIGDYIKQRYIHFGILTRDSRQKKSNEKV